MYLQTYVYKMCTCGLVQLCVYAQICAGSSPDPGCWDSLQGVTLCFGLCARGQVKTVLNVLHDFEERIQESEQSWQISAWRVKTPCSTAGFQTTEHSASHTEAKFLLSLNRKFPLCVSCHHNA
jgi:hypothetical protein